MVEIIIAILRGLLGGLGFLWSRPWGRAALFSLSFFIFGLYQGISFMSNRMDALKKIHVVEMKRALDNRDSEWQAKLSKANDDHEAELTKAIEAGNMSPSAATNADLERLCRDSATATDCRSAKGNRVQGVQKPHVGRN